MDTEEIQHEVTEEEDQAWDAFFEIWCDHTDVEILEMLRERLAETLEDQCYHPRHSSTTTKAEIAFLHFELGQLLERLSKFHKHLEFLDK